MPRLYQPVWDKIIADPGKSVKVKVTGKDPKLAQRIRKAVWKEKDLCCRKNQNGTFLKELYRLTCEIVEIIKDGQKEKHLVFRLVPSNHIENL